jgi:hypothetical protein
MSLDGAHHANEPTLFDETALDDYVGTPSATASNYGAPLRLDPLRDP